jgi:RNA polymerase sigma-70 factor (ECF subfamily)
MHQDGATLARRFLDGQVEAVRIVEGWVRSSAGSFRRRLGTDWEDAVQESLLEVTEALREDRVRNPERLRAWVFRAAAHTCLDRVRKRRRWSWVDADEVALNNPPSALRRLLEQGTVGTLLDLVGRCPEHCRDLWQMILEGLSYREMSERTGLAEGTLRVRVLRCRRLAQDLARDRDRAARPAGDPAGADSPEAGRSGTCDEPVTNGASGRRDRVNGKDHAV